MSMETKGTRRVIRCLVYPVETFCESNFPHCKMSTPNYRWYMKTSEGTRRVTHDISFWISKCRALPSRSLRSLSPLLSTSHDRARTPSSQTISSAWIYNYTWGALPSRSLWSLSPLLSTSHERALALLRVGQVSTLGLHIRIQGACMQLWRGVGRGGGWVSSPEGARGPQVSKASLWTPWMYSVLWKYSRAVEQGRSRLQPNSSSHRRGPIFGPHFREEGLWSCG